MSHTEKKEETITMADNQNLSELIQLKKELEYWKNKSLEKNLETLENTYNFAKIKEKLRSEMNALSNRNQELKNNINNINQENKVLLSNIQENERNILDSKEKTPQIENDNMLFYNEV